MYKNNVNYHKLIYSYTIYSLISLMDLNIGQLENIIYLYNLLRKIKFFYF